MPRNKRPNHFEKLTIYEELRFYGRKFAQAAYNCLVFIGPPGRLKSSIIRNEVGGIACYIQGNSTPFEAFCKLQQYVVARGPNIQLAVFDDTDSLYKTSEGQRFVKQVTDPIIPKLVGWTSIAPTNRELDQEFETTCKTCIIDNAWNAQNEHILALEDRARLFLFDPPPGELHREMSRQKWFRDTEVFDFIGTNLHFFSELSARTYVKAAEAKAAGEDWRKFVLRTCTTPDDMELLLLEFDPKWMSKSVDRKAKEWCRRTGRSRATYFNRKRELVFE